MSDLVTITLKQWESDMNEAREEGREEIRAKMRHLFEVFAPHAHPWWDKVNDVIEHRKHYND